MMLYDGHGSNESVVIAVIGDGVGKEVTVDLKKAPFDLSFPVNFYPVAIAMLVQDGPTPTVVLGSQGVLTISWDEPLQAPTSETGYSPRSQFQLWLLYQG